MKSEHSTVSERGQTAIPARLRRQSGVVPGTRLAWEAEGKDAWRVRIIRKSPGPVDPMQALGYATRFRPRGPTRQWMRELREGEA